MSTKPGESLPTSPLNCLTRAVTSWRRPCANRGTPETNETPGATEAPLELEQVLTTVRDAIHGGRVVPVYQPQMLVGSGAVDGLEALVRIEHGDGRLGLPGEFMSAFGKLAPTQREALLLAVLEGQSYEVIAAHTGVSVGTVKSRISRARDTLERLLLEGDSKERTESVDRTTAQPEDGASASSVHGR